MIKRILLKNFRNYSNLDLKVDSEINVFTGRNGQGKSNLLEAVFFMSMLRSFRTSRINNLKTIGAGSFYIGMENFNGRWNNFLEVEYGEGNSRKLKIDKTPVNRASDFIRQIKTVVFSPEDIDIVTGNSGMRRRFFDMLISVREEEYMNALQTYALALRSRNAMLRSGRAEINVLKAFEPVMARSAAFIIRKRIEYVKMLENEISGLLKNFHKDKKFSIVYRNNSSERDENALLKKFDVERGKELKRGFTSFGPHLDEFDILLNKRILRHYGSTGQARLISLCLKMAKINLLSQNEQDNKRLIVLVDDVTGDLDATVKELFFETINNAGQVFFTFTELPDDDKFKNAEVFHIENGAIK